ncbi:tetratricopeptide repeat protein [Streptomyces sp. NPDC002928]|uniref:ATP-binding protein n=1 Tax=Streptomyces sp. NPDC002928 TaxID=3154440 RepID=UPI0033BC719D
MTSTQRSRHAIPTVVFCVTAAGIFFGIIAGRDAGEDLTQMQLTLATLAGVLSGGLAYWQVKVQIDPRRSADIRNSSARNLPGTGNLFQLPPDIEDFTGHFEQAAELAATLLNRTTDTAVSIAALYGKGGVGKTTLAVHVAHRVRSHFADGQIYVNLRGAESRPLDPAEALTRFLNELGVDSDSIPESVEDRARLYRAQLAERRVLVVLDNAGSEAQIRPLLPGGAECAVLITSRVRLAGLSGAHMHQVDVMTREHGVELLKAVIGVERVRAEPRDAEEIVALCGMLPLALRIAGARLSSRPMERIEVFAARLRDERRRLDLLQVGDLAVRANFTLSYDACGDELKRCFRLLGIVKAQDFSAVTLGALAELSTEDAERHLDGLLDLELLEIAGVDPLGNYRYRFHDLLRVFARECLDAVETVDARKEAAARVVSLYMALTVNAAALLTKGGVDRPVQAEPRALEVLAADPLGWARRERFTFLSAVELAREHGLDADAWRLADVIARLPYWPTDWVDWTRVQQLGLQAALAEGSKAGEASLRRNLGTLHRDRGEYDDAERELSTAAAIFDGEGDALGAAITSGMLGDTCRYTGKLEEGIANFLRALEEFRSRDLPSYLAWVLNGLSDLYRGCSRWQEAIDGFTECIRIYDELGNRHAAACARIRFGIVHRDRCHYALAEPLYQEGLRVLRAEGDRRWEARALRHLGVLWRNMGRTREAIGTLQEALAIFEELADRRGIAVVQRNLADAYRRHGDRDKALGCLADALAGFQELHDRRWEARTRISLAETLRGKGHGDEATQHLDAAAEIYEAMGYPPGKTRVTYCRGLLYQDQRDWQRAAEAFAVSRAAFDDQIWALRALARTAEVQKARGDRSWRETQLAATAGCRSHGARDDAEAALWLAAW